MSTVATPRFRELSREEAEDLLSRNHVGRIAYATGRSVDIEPIHYVYSDGWIYGRTSYGAKLVATWEQWSPVAFEVDEVEGPLRWQSVVVHGGIYTLPPEGEERERAVEKLRTLFPEAFTPDDPVPFRSVVFRIAAEAMRGREARAADG